MTELEKIEYAKSFIDKLANGINPLDDTMVYLSSGNTRGRYLMLRVYRENG